MSNEPIQTSSKRNPSIRKLLLLVIAPNLFWLILLNIDSREGMGVTVLFLAANLICSVVVGVGVAHRLGKSGLATVIIAFFISVVLFFINWGIAIIADMMFFNPMHS